MSQNLRGRIPVLMHAEERNPRRRDPSHPSASRACPRQPPTGNATGAVFAAADELEETRRQPTAWFPPVRTP